MERNMEKREQTPKPAADCALELKGVNMFYGDKQVLHDISLRLRPDRVYGLLGRNGAGKTTLINIISAQHFSSKRSKAGEVFIYGNRVFESAEALSRLCVIREKTNMPDTLRVRDALSAAQSFYPNWDAQYAAHLVERFALDPYKKYKALSRGMESALGLIIGLASRAPLTVFDEPSLGLDAAAREYFYDELAHDFVNNPRTVIISTHMIDEGARMFQDIIIMDRGRIKLCEPMSELLDGALTVTGEPEEVRRQTQGMQLLYEEEALPDDAQAAQSVIDNDQGYFSPRDYRRETEHTSVRMLSRSVRVPAGASFEPGVALKRLPLQKLFVYMTEDNGDAN